MTRGAALGRNEALNGFYKSDFVVLVGYVLKRGSEVHTEGLSMGGLIATVVAGRLQLVFNKSNLSLLELMYMERTCF